jgi:hypothetical protein
MNDTPLEFRLIPGPYSDKIKADMQGIRAFYQWRWHSWSVMDFAEDRAHKILADHANDPPMVEMNLVLRGPDFKDERKLLCIFGAAWDPWRKVWLIPPDQVDYADKCKAKIAELVAKRQENRRLNRLFIARQARAAETPEQATARREARAAAKRQARAAETPEQSAARREARVAKEKTYPAYLLRLETRPTREVAQQERLAKLRAATAERREAAKPIREEKQKAAQQERLAKLRAATAQRRATLQPIREEKQKAAQRERLVKLRAANAERRAILQPIREEIQGLTRELRLVDLRRETSAKRIRIVASLSENAAFDMIQDQCDDDERSLDIETRLLVLRAKLKPSPVQEQLAA